MKARHICDKPAIFAKFSFAIKLYCVKVCMPHKNFMQILIALLRTEAKLESIKAIHMITDPPVYGA